MAGKKKDFSELHNGIITELTGVERARGELHVALINKFKTLTLGQLSTQLIVSVGPTRVCGNTERIVRARV